MMILMKERTGKAVLGEPAIQSKHRNRQFKSFEISDWDKTDWIPSGRTGVDKFFVLTEKMHYSENEQCNGKNDG
jgi:hypothetical protein